MVFRRHLIDLIAGGAQSVSSLARDLGTTRREMEADLRHAIRSARAQGHDVQIVPARCKSCGFEFGDDRLAKPGRCPACKGTRLHEALIGLRPPPGGE